MDHFARLHRLKNLEWIGLGVLPNSGKLTVACSLTMARSEVVILEVFRRETLQDLMMDVGRGG